MFYLCHIRVFTHCESGTRAIFPNLGSTEAGRYRQTRGDVVLLTAFQGGDGRTSAVDFVVCVDWGGISYCFRRYFLL